MFDLYLHPLPSEDGFSHYSLTVHGCRIAFLYWPLLESARPVKFLWKLEQVRPVPGSWESWKEGTGIFWVALCPLMLHFQCLTFTPRFSCSPFQGWSPTESTPGLKRNWEHITTNIIPNQPSFTPCFISPFSYLEL